MFTVIKRYRNPFLVFLAGLTCTVALAAGPKSGGGGLWLSGGQDNHNNRSQPTEDQISPANAGDLTIKWVFTTAGDVTATPAVDETNVYVPDWGGKLYSLDRETGAENWSINIGDYTGLPAGLGGVSRATPAVHGHSIILGDQGGRAGLAGASVLSVDKNTGALNWITLVEDHMAALVTQSPVVHGNIVYVGVASNDEAFAAFIPGYPCCSFRGSVVALDANTGDILWKTYMAPAASTGFSGNAVWGSTPVVDTRRGSIYVTTGNNYTAPADILVCVAAAGNDNGAVKECMDAVPGNHFDSVVALDMNTGAIKWATKALPYDAWTVACIFPIPDNPGFPGGNLHNCPDPAGPDYDFGQGPALFTVRGNRGMPRDLLGAGQKSGQYWALDPDDGNVVWVTQVGPGGVLGGLQWGSATDGERIYTAVTDVGWSALDASTGEVLWSTAKPSFWPSFGAVTVANGVVFAGSMDPFPTPVFNPSTNNMFALDAATGDILFSFASDGSVGSGASVVDGTVYWGSGYTVLGPPFTGNDKLYAFEVP
jgi:polyvinyl alcohol dehydrogenase (cytochrome)